MNGNLLPLLPLLCLSLGLSVDEMPRKSNMVSKLVDSFLSKLSDDVTLDDLNVPGVGRFSQVTVSILDGLDKSVDGDGTYGLKLETTLRRLTVTGRYDIDIPGPLPIFGKGDFSVKVNETFLKLHLKAKPNFETDQFDVDLRVFEVSLQNPRVRLEGLMDDPPLADFLNDLLSAILPDLIRVLQGYLRAFLQPVLDFFLNEVIKCIKLEALTGHLEECIRNITRLGEATWNGPHLPTGP